jgi:NAD(P)-dependent dehydrogenase (short-subunit alcohol dehydrogenase family)
MGRLDGKVALISGGTSGIGEATARLFREEGAIVIATGASAASVATARERLPGVDVIESDAGDTQAIRALVDGVIARHGGIDILFANAGIAFSMLHTEIDEAIFDRQFEVNVRGTYFLLKSAAAVMRDGGSIVLTGSVAGSTGGDNLTIYGSSKAALRSFARTFASELAGRGIRVNIVSPGPIVTPILAKSGFSDSQVTAFRDNYAQLVPLGRIGLPEEVAKAVLFFASDDSSYTTGAELYVDGGLADL